MRAKILTILLLLTLGTSVSMAQESSDFDRMRGEIVTMGDQAEANDTTAPTGELYFTEGRIHEAEGDFPGAYDFYRKAFRIDSTNYRSVYRGGRILDSFGRIEDAHAAYLRTIAIEPQFYPAYNSLGILLSRKDLPGEAWRVFHGGVDVAPDYAPAWRNLGRAAAILGNIEAATKAFEQAVKLEPDEASSRVTLGILYAWDWKLVQSREQLQRAVELDPGNHRAQKCLAWVDANATPGIKEPREVIAAEPPPPPPPALKSEKRIDWAFVAPEASVDYSELRTQRGVALVQLGRYREAVPELRDAAHHGSQDERVYAALGYALYRLGDDEGAAEAYKRAVKLAIIPEPWYQINLGAAYQRSGRYGAAAKAYKRALKIDSDTPRAHYALGLLRLETGDNKRALKSLVESVRLDPEHGPSHAALAVALVRNNRRDDAMIAYRNAARLMPSDPDVRMSLARLYDEQGLVLDAAEEYIAYLKLTKDLPQYREWREVALQRVNELTKKSDASAASGWSGTVREIADRQGK